MNNIEKKILESEERICQYVDKKCENLQRRLQYDIKQRSQEILTEIKSTSVGSNVRSFLENTENLQLPVENMEKFLLFEEELKNNTETCENLVNMHFYIITYL